MTQNVFHILSLSDPEFYVDLVYKFKINVSTADYSDQNKFSNATIVLDIIQNVMR